MSSQAQQTPTNNPYLLADAAAKVIAEKTGIATHDIALTLGSGWGEAAELIGETRCEIPAAELPGFYAAQVPGHRGTVRSILSKTGKNVLVLGARTHLYEGHGPDAVAHSIRTAAAAGVKTVVLTNGAGGIKDSWQAGQPVLIKDQINLTGATPLSGARFFDMTDLYTPRLRELARSIDPSLDEGIYCGFHGPQYETPAEVQMARVIGGDIVGMSTVLEAIAAREAGLEILGLSLITNLAAGISPNPLSHEEVLAAADAAGPKISRLLAEIVNSL